MDQLERDQQEIAGRREFFYKAFRTIQFNGVSGDYAEFGSHTANTFRLAYTYSRSFRSRCHLWAFDSFAGLPEAANDLDKHARWTPGTLSISQKRFVATISKFGIRPGEYSIVSGYYEESLNRDGEKYPSDIALAYIDCDLFSSTTTVLAFLRTRMKHGMIIAFDDYYCYSPDLPSGERLAFLEFAASSTEYHFLPFAQFGWHGMSFIVESREGRSDLIPAGIGY